MSTFVHGGIVTNNFWPFVWAQIRQSSVNIFGEKYRSKNKGIRDNGSSRMQFTHGNFLLLFCFRCRSIVHIQRLPARQQPAVTTKWEYPLTMWSWKQKKKKKNPFQTKHQTFNGIFKHTTHAVWGYEVEEMAAEEFVLRWNNHQQNFAAVVEDLWRHDTFTDVILCSEGRVFPAHRVILSACSPYFLEILSKVPEHQHPVVFLQGVPLKDLHSLLTFMYSGEVVVSAGCDMASFFRTAENLQIKGKEKKNSWKGHQYSLILCLIWSQDWPHPYCHTLWLKSLWTPHLAKARLARPRTCTPPAAHRPEQEVQEEQEVLLPVHLSPRHPEKSGGSITFCPLARARNENISIATATLPTER